MIAVLRRELQAYFSSVLAWILMGVILFLHGILFVRRTAYFSDYSIQAARNPFGGGADVHEWLVGPTIVTMGFLMLFILPMLTMRLFAEERRSGTLDLLLTYPLTEAQIIGGKFLAALSVAALVSAFSFSSFLMLARAAPPGQDLLEWPIVAAAYGGLLLLAGAVVAFGLWCSSLTSSQLVAAVVSYGGLLVAWLVSELDRSQFFKESFGELSFAEHLSQMARGVVDTHSVVYFVGWIALFLFLTARVLESRKWRG